MNNENNVNNLQGKPITNEAPVQVSNETPSQQNNQTIAEPTNPAPEYSLTNQPNTITPVQTFDTNTQIAKTKNKKNKGIIIAIIAAIIVIALVVAGFFIFNKSDDKEKTKKSTETKNTEIITEEPTKKQVEEIKDQLWIDYNNGEIDINEYVKMNLYVQFDPSKAPEKYLTSTLKLDDFISKHYDELSEETLKLYIYYLGLPNLTFESEENSNLGKNLANVKLEEKEETKETAINLNEVYLSSKGHFLIWYTKDGISKITEEDAKKIGEHLENTIDEYEKKFGLSYRFSSYVQEPSKRYKEQVKILENKGIKKDYISTAMHVYIYDFGNNNTAGVYNKYIIKDKFIEFLWKYLEENEDQVVVSPYFRLNTYSINHYESFIYDVINHEFFHHYQAYVINNSGEPKDTIDTIISEATANWAAAEITENEKKDLLINGWASNYIKNTGSIFTTRYEKNGNKIGYGLYRFINALEDNVPNGKQIILDSIHQENGFEYLHNNTTMEERKTVMSDLTLKNLSNKDQNNNYLPEEGVELITTEINDNNELSKEFKLSAAGIEYYTFSSKLNNEFEVEINLKEENWGSIYLYAEKDNKFKLISSSSEIKQSFEINQKDYEDYDNLYIAVVNNNFYGNKDYEIKISIKGKKEIENDEVFKTKFKNYRIKITSTVSVYGIETVSYVEGIVDQEHQKEYLKATSEVMGMEITMETYSDFAKGITYSQNPITGEWEKNKDVSQVVDISNILDKFNDHGTVTKISKDEYKVKLTKKDIKGLLNTTTDMGEFNISGDIYVTAHLKDNYITKLEYDFSNVIKGIDSFKTVIDLYDYDNAPEVKIPVEVTR